MLKEEIKELSRQLHGRVIENRRYLHAHPELSFREYETCAFIRKQLAEMGIACQILAGTGVVAVIEGAQASEQVIALRADMDALPITEANTTGYVSQNPGIMHACGHDAHVSSLLGTAQILQTLKSRFGGTVKLIFQPGEEKIPGGASLMIEAGVLENPAPQFLIGQHVMPDIPAGMIGLKKGHFMASHDEIYITIHGKGGHGAAPHQNTDPVMMAVQILQAMQQVVSRKANPVFPTVLSFGKIVANGATNIIPDKVYIEGTLRTFDESWRREAQQYMQRMAEGIAESMGGSCTFDIVRGYPSLYNAEKLTEQVAAAAGEYVGNENVLDLDCSMYAEDFSFYSQAADSCFYFLGAGNRKKGISSPLHSSTFEIDEDAFLLSTGLMAFIALSRLETAR